MTIPSILTSKTLTFYVQGHPYSVDRSHVAWDEIKDLLNSESPDVSRLILLSEPVGAIKSAVEEFDKLEYLPRGSVTVTRNSVLFNGEPLDDSLTSRILDLLGEGLNIMPMVRFVENLMMNPSQSAREELYLWLEESDLPITEDGCFIAYKRVQDNFKSVYDGVTDNTPGTVVEMPRHQVDPHRDRTCSRGLHFCSKSYLPHYSEGRTVVLVKVNPADVVSIPSDYSNAKGRAWKYEVIEKVEFNIESIKWGALYAEDDEDLDDLDEFDDDEGEDEEILRASLRGELFGAINESQGRVDRTTRLKWATDQLGYPVGSFNELTPWELAFLTNKVRNELVVSDGRPALKALGIVDLRRRASRLGLKSAWRSFTKDELIQFILDKEG